MTLQEYIDDIRLELTGYKIGSDLEDDDIARIVNKSLREIQRYIDTPRYVTIPYSQCINLEEVDIISSIVKVYRAEALNGRGGAATSSSGYTLDPMYAQQWAMYNISGGSMFNLNNQLLNILSYQTMLQIENTFSTDLSFTYDKQAKKLYINIAYNIPDKVTIEYIPVYKDVIEITSDYWKDILLRLSVAQTKQILGRIRTRFEQTNAQWKQDGELILAEGNNELEKIRETLSSNASLFFPID